MLSPVMARVVLMPGGRIVEAHVDAAPGEVEHTEDLGVDWWPLPGEGVLGPVTVPAPELVEKRFSSVARWKRPGGGKQGLRAGPK